MMYGKPSYIAEFGIGDEVSTVVKISSLLYEIGSYKVGKSVTESSQSHIIHCLHIPDMYIKWL